MSLHVCCIPGFATLWLADRLAGFIAENPELHVDFRPSDQTPDFRGKDVDCDIRYVREWETGNLPRGVRRLEIARPTVFPVASPDLLAKLPPIETADDLIACPLLHEDSDDEWTRWLAAQGTVPSEPLTGPRLWHAHLTLSAARRGRGIALANNMLIGDDLKSGHLLPVTPRQGQFVPADMGSYVLLAREDRWNAPAVLRFRRWIQRAVSET
jgi:DNA-binding transcriptional LysR family regulator